MLKEAALASKVILDVEYELLPTIGVVRVEPANVKSLAVPAKGAVPPQLPAVLKLESEPPPFQVKESALRLGARKDNAMMVEKVGLISFIF